MTDNTDAASAFFPTTPDPKPAGPNAQLMLKTTLKGLACVVSLLSLSFLFSCSKDETDSSSPKGKVGVFTTEDGDQLMLKKITTGSGKTLYSVDYDDSWRPIYIIGDWMHFNFSYDPFSVVWGDVDAGYCDEGDVTITFTGAGYVSSVSENYYGEDGEDNETETVLADFTYDSSGHLTGITASSKISGRLDGEKFSNTWQSTSTFTWAHGNLIKADYKVSEKDSDGDSWEDSETDYFEYGSASNEYKQPNQALADAFCEMEYLDYVWDLTLIGWFGVGTADLLETVSGEYIDPDYGAEEWSDTYSYTKYGDGSIKTESYGTGSTYTYTYWDLNDYETRSGGPLVIDDDTAATDSSDSDNARTAGGTKAPRSRHFASHHPVHHPISSRRPASGD